MPAAPAPSTDPALLAVTSPGAGVTAIPGRAASADTDQSSIPTRVAAAPPLATSVARVPGHGWRPGLLVVIAATIGLVGLALAGGLYVLMAPPRQASTAAAPPTGAVEVPPAAVAAEPSPAVTVGGIAPPPQTSSARAGTGARTPAEQPAPPPTLARRPDPEPRDAAPTRMAAVPPPVTAPPATAPAPQATAPLRLDVVAVQPSFGAQAASMEVEVNVDGRPARTATVRFDGTTPFARSRRRQMVEVPGVPVGRRTVGIVVRADGGIEPIEARTEATVGEGAPAVVVDVRLRGNGEGDAKFR